MLGKRVIESKATQTFKNLNGEFKYQVLACFSDRSTNVPEINNKMLGSTS